MVDPLDILKSRYPWPAARPDVEPDGHGWLVGPTSRMITGRIPPGARLIVEIGSWLGLSTRLLLDHCREATILCVDTWAGSPEHREDPAQRERLSRLWPTFLRNQWDRRQRIVPVKADSLVALRELADLELPAEAVYLDGEHTYDRLRREIRLVAETWPAAVIVCDDWNNRDVRLAVKHEAAGLPHKLIANETAASLTPGSQSGGRPSQLRGRNVRLVRRVDRPDGRGPGNGQHMLQRALQRRIEHQGIEWLAIGGEPLPDELAWYWCWADVLAALARNRLGRPFVIGPNVFFIQSNLPLSGPGERDLAAAGHCRLIFTESTWYAELIHMHIPSDSTVPVVIWHYPVDPVPGEPSEPIHDLLIYSKSGPRPVETLSRIFPRSIAFRYGHYDQAELWKAARASRACVYLSDDDRGPLALAEILLSGCPVVGHARGAPWIEPGVNGELLPTLADPECISRSVRRLWYYDRRRVRRIALAEFSTERACRTILCSLQKARRDETD